MKNFDLEIRDYKIYFYELIQVYPDFPMVEIYSKKSGHFSLKKMSFELYFENGIFEIRVDARYVEIFQVDYS